jgi:hypothetical protein
MFAITEEVRQLVSNQKNPGHKGLMDDLKKLKIDSTFSDAVLVADGKAIPVHRSILAARSDMFRTMFSEEKFVEGY